MLVPPLGVLAFSSVLHKVLYTLLERTQLEPTERIAATAPMEEGEEPQRYSNSNHVILNASLIKHFSTQMDKCIGPAIYQFSEASNANS